MSRPVSELLAALEKAWFKAEAINSETPKPETAHAKPAPAEATPGTRHIYRHLRTHDIILLTGAPDAPSLPYQEKALAFALAQIAKPLKRKR